MPVKLVDLTDELIQRRDKLLFKIECYKDYICDEKKHEIHGKVFCHIELTVNEKYIPKRDNEYYLKNKDDSELIKKAFKWLKIGFNENKFYDFTKWKIPDNIYVIVIFNEYSFTATFYKDKPAPSKTLRGEITVPLKLLVLNHHHK